MKKTNPKNALVFTAATGTLLLLGGCCHDDCPVSPEQKDIVYEWDIPESQDDCAPGTIYTDDSGGMGGDLDGTGIVDRDGTGIVDRDDNLVLQYCLRPCAGGEIPSDDVYMIWSNPNDFIEAGPDCEAAPPPDEEEPAEDE